MGFMYIYFEGKLINQFTCTKEEYDQQVAQNHDKRYTYKWVAFI